jgi:hypothetical protein
VELCILLKFKKLVLYRRPIWRCCDLVRTEDVRRGGRRKEETGEKEEEKEKRRQGRQEETGGEESNLS